MSTSGGIPGPMPDRNATRQPDLVACAVITWAVAALFVALRFYTRGRLIRVLGAEDWCILASLFFSALISAGMVDQVRHGLGIHYLYVDLADFPPIFRESWLTLLWYHLTLYLTKTSILLLYYRILTYQHARWAVHAIMAFVVLSTIYTFVLCMTYCIPLQAMWDYTVQATYCHPRSFWWAATCLYMASDFLIFALPMPIIFNLRASTRQKVLLYCIFAFGFLVTLISLIRLVYLIQIPTWADFTYDSVPLSYWTCLEVNTAIVCACVMTLKPFLTHYFPSLTRSRPTSSPTGHSPHESAGGAPLTIGSRPVRNLPHDDRQSWLIIRDGDDIASKTDGFELSASNKELEAHANRNAGLKWPNRPHIRDPWSPGAESVDGLEVDPRSMK